MKVMIWELLIVIVTRSGPAMALSNVMRMLDVPDPEMLTGP